MEYCIFVEPQNGADYDELLAFARTAERLGFDGFFRSDHYLAMDGDGLPGPTDAWTTIAAMSRETERIRLGTLVSSATFRHPGVLAIQVAQADRMSGGRVELGLGTGWFAREHEAYGIPFPAKRFGMLEEQLAVITGLWSTADGDRFDFAGEHYTLSDSPALPKPVQRPIPVIVGGGGAKRTPAIAARYATEFNIGFVDESTIAAKFDGVRNAASGLGREPGSLKYSVALPTIVGADEAEVTRRAERVGLDPAERDVNLVGTPERVAERIARLRDLGAGRVYLQTLDVRDPDHLELIAAEVLPRLR